MKRKRRLPIADARYGPAVLAGIAEGEARAVAAAISAVPTRATAIAIARDSAERVEALTRAAIASETAAPAIACRSGCGGCCVSKVLAIAPEVLRIAEHLRETLSESERADLIARVEAADSRTRGLSRAERAEAGVPCPLLVDGSCSVYSVRPIVCRAWTSFDVGACHRYFAAPLGVPAPPVYAPQYEIGNAVLAGLGKGCVSVGRDGAPLELVAALRIALARPNAAERWLDRLPVFAQARDAEWFEAHVNPSP